MSLLAKRSMAAGEIGPALWARTDMYKYATGLRTLRNAIVKRFGGTESRAGASKVALTKPQNIPFNGPATRGFKFQFDNQQGYYLELGDEYARIFRNRRPVLVEPESIYWVDGKEGTDPAEIELGITPPLYAPGDEIYLYGIDQVIPEGLYEVDSIVGDRLTLKDLAGNSVTWNGSEWQNPFPSRTGFGEIFELVTPYFAEDLPEVRYAQSGDVIVFTHQSYPVQTLTRNGPNDDDWTWAAATFGPSISPPSPAPVATPNNVSPFAPQFYVTSVNAAGEESIRSALSNNATLTGSWSVTWTPVTDAVYYNVYVIGGGQIGLVGTTRDIYFNGNWTDGEVYLDRGASVSNTARNPFASSYPKCCGIYGQRLYMGNFVDNREAIFGSRVGSIFNFEVSVPTAPNDALAFSAAGNEVNPVQHLLDLALLMIFTETSEMVVNSDVITPANTPLATQTTDGSNFLAPIRVGGSAIFIQGTDSIVRDTAFTFESDGYRGNELSLFAYHLLDGYGIKAWAFQKTPDPVVWLVREDGKLISLTYVREQLILGWARHDMDDAFIEDVVSFKSNGKWEVWLTVRRIIDGNVVRTLEVLNHRFIRDGEAAKSLVCMDGAVSFDGRSFDDAYFDIKLTGGTSWDQYDTFTVESATTYQLFWGAAEVGNQIHLPTSDGGLLVLDVIAGDTDSQSVTVRPTRTVPVDLRDTVTRNWSRAIKTFRSLSHLEGRDVSILGDGWVLSSPYNPQVITSSVEDGEVELSKPCAVVHVGTPMLVDIETLNIDYSGSNSINDKKKKINEVGLQLDKTRGLFVGGRPPDDDSVDALQDLMSLKIRDLEGYNEPIALYTGYESVNILPEWNSNGRVFIRQVDPLPCSVLAVFPEGDYPPGNGG